MTTLYLVERGEYSDRHICAIFDSKEAADLYIERVLEVPDADGEIYASSYNKARIIERILNPGAEELLAGYRLYGVSMTRNGNVPIIPGLVTSDDSIYPDDIEVGYSWCNFADRKGKSFGVKSVYFLVFADGPERAIKVANERRTRLIAEDIWKA